MKQLVISNRLTNRETQSFNQYLKEIAEIDVFTPEEELLCAEKASLGDKESIDELVRRNLRFVVSVAKQYANIQNPLEDLVNEGNIGLMIAAEKFKLEMGFKFISYAVWWIRKVIIEHLNNHGRLVRLPANKINSLSTLDKKINELEQRLGRPVDIYEIIDEFGEDFKAQAEKRGAKSSMEKILTEYEDLDTLSSFTMDSLDRELSDGEHGVSLYETISDENNFTSTDMGLVKEDIKNDIRTLLGKLKPRDEQIMIYLYGLDGEDPKTLRDVSEIIGITTEMVRQVKLKSLDLLRNKIKGSRLETNGRA